MAKLKAQAFELEFAYYNLNICNEIEYSLNITLNGKPILNPAIIEKSTDASQNGKFIFSDCGGDEDWLHNFFIKILSTKKGNSYEILESPVWKFKAITWEDKRKDREKSWEGKTVKTSNENGDIVDEPCAEIAKMFVPLWENNIEFKIEIPHEVFDTEEYSTLELSFEITRQNLVKFLEEFGKEMNEFYHFFIDRIEYLGNGKYQEKEDFKHRFGLLDEYIYLEKQRAEWNREEIESWAEIILKILINHIRVRTTYAIVGTSRFLLKSSVSKDLVSEVFKLADQKLQCETDQEIIKRHKAVKAVIAIVFPDILTNAQINYALSGINKEDIPEELFDKNKTIYLQHLKNNTL